MSVANGDEPLNEGVRGLHGLHGAGRDHPVVTRKDSLSEVAATENRFGRRDAA
jgi:hypothetical protein